MLRNKLDLRQDVFHIPSHLVISLGLRWEFIGHKPVDLDASCVAFTAEGKCLEAVFFNNLHSRNYYMWHSGDNTTGENTSEDDETINFDMSKIPPEVAFLFVSVTSYTGALFTVVEKATCRLINLTTKQVVHHFSLGVVGNHTATLLCALSRSEVQNENNIPETLWILREINIPCNGYTFADVIPKMLDLLAVQDSQREEALADLPDYSLVKDPINNIITPSQVKFGLGWDGEFDLDACAVLVDEFGNYVDHVYAKYGKLRGQKGAIVHSGDKLNGYDVKGDDEFIIIDLNLVEPRVGKVYFIALLYEGPTYLENVPKGYVRLQNKAPKESQYRELDRFQLSNASNACSFIFSMVSREHGSVWSYVPINESVSYGRDWIDIFPYLRCHAKFSDKGREVWKQWLSVAKNQFWVELSFLEARDLGPLEPHQFACHCVAWVCDRKCKNRSRSSVVNTRETITWDDKAYFLVSMTDRIRVLLYEHSLVGHVDLDLSEIDCLSNGSSVEGWYSLLGVNITGELRLKLRPIASSEKKLIVQKTNEKKLNWCSIF